jgi:Uma2 family endonuclease
MPVAEPVRERTDYEIERNKPRPSPNHAIIQGNLLFQLNLQYQKKYSFLPEVSLSLPGIPVAVPDISVYPKLTADFLHDIGTMTESPWSIIEIISPSQSTDEVLLKFERCFNAGVRSCWLVIPGLKAIAVYAKADHYQFYTSDMLLQDKELDIELPMQPIFGI